MSPFFTGRRYRIDGHTNAMVAVAANTLAPPTPAILADWCWRAIVRRDGVAVQLFALVTPEARTTVFVQRVKSAFICGAELMATVTDMAREAHARLGRIRGGV